MRLEYFNEVMVMFLSYSKVCMTAYVLDSEVVYEVGHSFIILFLILVAGNLIYITNILFKRYLELKRSNYLEQRFVNYVEMLFEKKEK